MKLAIVGNSASGKTSLARGLEARHGLAHLDLDTIAWTAETTRRPLEESRVPLEAFFAGGERWVVEGCYADLLALCAGHGAELIWLDPGPERCLEHAEHRPFEAHKFASPEDQDAKLPMLREWIRGYETRTDDMSRSAHQQMFDDWAGPKRQVAQATDLLGHAIHPQLRADTHLLGETEAGTLLLHRNAALNWIILVPDVGPTDLRELLDLDEQRRSRVFAVSRRVAAVLRARGAHKVNVASLGNLVPQLHIHLIGRHPGDACWPLPVWGHLQQETPWDPEDVATLRAALVDE